MAQDELPVPVRTVCTAYLELVDAAVPGLVEGLYLHGSLAFGEWHAATSDVDFVAVSSRRPIADELEILRAVHGDLAAAFPRPTYDGCYLTWEDLSGPPDDVPDVACIIEGDWQDAGRVAVNPVTWHEIAGHGIAVRGPEPAAVVVWADHAVLLAFTHRNLRDYWGPRVSRLREHVLEAGEGAAVAWFVLGPARLHYLLTTGRLTTKDGAGQHVVEAFGERWRPLVAEAIAYRATGEVAGVLDQKTCGRQVAELAAAVIESGRLIDVPSA